MPIDGSYSYGFASERIAARILKADEKFDPIP